MDAAVLDFETDNTLFSQQPYHSPMFHSALPTFPSSGASYYSVMHRRVQLYRDILNATARFAIERDRQRDREQQSSEVSTTGKYF